MTPLEIIKKRKEEFRKLFPTLQLPSGRFVMNSKGYLATPECLKDVENFHNDTLLEVLEGLMQEIDARRDKMLENQMKEVYGTPPNSYYLQAMGLQEAYLIIFNLISSIKAL